MATIPTSLGAPLQPQSRRGIVRVDTGALDQTGVEVARQSGEGLRAIAKGAADIATAYDTLQIQDDKRNAKSLLIQYSDQLREISSNYSALQGEDALNNRQSTIEAINKAREKLISTSSNKNIRQMFEEASTTLQQSELDTVDKHSLEQRQVAEQTISKAMVQNAISDAAANYNNPNTLKRSLFIAENEAVVQADRAGIRDKAAREVMVKAARTDIYSSAILAAAENDPELARTILKTHRDNIDGDVAYKLDAEIKQQENALRVQQEHEMLMAEKARKDASDAKVNAFLSAVLTNQSFDFQAFASDPTIDASSKLTAWNMLETKNKRESAGEKITDDAGVYLSTWDRIHLPSSNPDAITNPDDLTGLVGQGLTLETVQKFREEMRGTKTQAGQIENDLKDQAVRQIRTTLSGTDPLIGIKDSKGDASVTQYMIEFLDRYSRGRDAGKTAQELLTATSPDYVMKDLENRKRSRAAFLQDLFTDNPNSDKLVPSTGTVSAKVDLSKATEKRYNPTTKKTAYKVDGKWYDENGEPL